MRLGLIGATGHLHTYAPALQHFPQMKLAAVAVAGPEETTGAFDHVPGLTVETKRYEDAQRMLEREKLDVAQVCCRPDRIPFWTKACLERGIAVMAEKPLAMDLRTLADLYQAAEKSKTPLIPMHTQRGEATLAAVARAVRAGEIGEPLAGFSQKTYKWGNSRPDYFRSRRTFPGIAPFIGIHALDWLYWILGDVFVEVTGRQSTAARPDFTACASNAAFVLKMKNGGTIALTLDYLRPAAAPTHGDERVRIAGTRGVIEAVLIEDRATLTTMERAPHNLPLTPQPDIFTAFVRSLRGEGPPPLSPRDTFRITEIALKTQQALDTGRVVSLV